MNQTMSANTIMQTINQALLQFVTNKKQVILLIISVAITVLIVMGVMISQTARGLIDGYDLSKYDIRNNNQILLDIFRQSVLIFVFATVVSVGILLYIGVKLEYIYIVAALGIGTAYMISVTPLSVPDEPHHYHSTYAISGFILMEQEPLKGEGRHFDYRGLSGHYNVPSSYLRLLNEGIYISKEESGKIDIPQPYNFSYPLSYAPQALGVFIARIIGLSFYGVFYLGRFFNLLFYTLCVAFSIKRIKAFKVPILLIGLLPMSLHQAASFSYDSFINGISILFIAYAVSYIYEKRVFNWKDYFIILMLAILLAPAKAVYVPIVFMVILVVKNWKEYIGNLAWVLSIVILFI